MNKQYKHQGGWVASFLIVGILLTLAVLGGLYYIKANQKKLASGNSDPATSQTTTVEPADDSTESSDVKEQGETVDTNSQSAAGSGAGSATDSKNPGTSGSGASTQTSPSTGASGSTAKLPATGPEDTALNAGILAIIAFSATTYIRSRQLS